ncbi:hypothetical protein J1605_006496 [Eschrichtius robustus]|uniref:Uncharacterized protein n=1 Tax=Eschrichtius robustus TaxID=9764 RepID=A0AB34H5D7_ESCRO|nr:hypothetical protein J1605_006496 [Eschrichtius robustus]
MAFTVADWAFQKELVPLGLVSRASETEGLTEMATICVSGGPSCALLRSRKVCVASGHHTKEWLHWENAEGMVPPTFSLKALKGTILQNKGEHQKMPPFMTWTQKSCNVTFSPIAHKATSTGKWATRFQALI